MTELESKIYEIVRKIPKGKVASYKQIAIAAGDVHLARFVGNTMHKNPVPFYELARSIGYEIKKEWETEYKSFINFAPVPCHRVVNSAGKMGSNFGLGGPEVQSKMLTAENVDVVDGIVDFHKYSVNWEG